MTTDELNAMDARALQEIEKTRAVLLRLEGYRLCIADMLRAAALKAQEAANAVAADEPVTVSTGEGHEAAA